MTASINGIEYEYSVHQNNPGLPFLLILHGFMGSGRVFEHLLEKLSGFTNPVTIDLLGHGETEGSRNPERYSPKNQLQDLHEIVSKLQINNLFLLGYSMGGRLALRYALAYPETLSGLILESTNYGITDPEARKERIQTDKKRANAIEKDFNSFLTKWENLSLFTPGVPVNETLKDRYRQIQQQQNTGYMAASLRGFGNGQILPVRDKLAELDLPVLLMAGEKDEKYISVLSEMDTLLPNSELHIIKGAGHRVHIDNPEAYIRRLKVFITSANVSN